MDASNPRNSAKEGAGNGYFPQTNVIDHISSKKEDEEAIDPPISPIRSRKKRKVQSGGVECAQNIKQAEEESSNIEDDEEGKQEEEEEKEEEEDEYSSNVEYKHKVAYSLKRGQKMLDLDEADALLQEIVNLDETPSEEGKSMGAEDFRSQESTPLSVLEKGIIYFFYRPILGVVHVRSLKDLKQSFFILRPLPLRAKISKGPFGDDKNARLLSLPKKIWLQSIQDRFFCIVEKAGLSIEELKAHLLGSSDTAPVTPIAEGIYAITSTGRESHLVYHVTNPAMSEIQKKQVIKKEGSLVCSIMNPNAPGSANEIIDKPAKYSDELQQKFGNLRWTSMVPEHLNYEGTQMLITGEIMLRGEEDEENSPWREMIKLQHEDHDRVEALKSDNPMFKDLDLDAEDYPCGQTTW